jgi:hypothetical protein
MLPDNIRRVAVPWLFSSLQTFASLLAENKWKTRPLWSYYNTHEIKALDWAEECQGLTLLWNKG